MEQLMFDALNENKSERKHQLNENTSGWRWGKNIFLDYADRESITIPALYGVNDVMIHHNVNGPITKNGLKPLAIDNQKNVLKPDFYYYEGSLMQLYPNEVLRIIFDTGNSLNLPFTPDFRYRPELRMYKRENDIIKIYKEWRYSPILINELRWNISGSTISTLAPPESTILNPINAPLVGSISDNYVYAIPKFPLTDITISESVTNEEIDIIRGLIYLPKDQNLEHPYLSVTGTLLAVFSYVPKGIQNDYFIDKSQIFTKNTLIGIEQSIK
jgi:hypothetical protein